MIDKGEEFLINLYVKSKDNIRSGCNVEILEKMMGINSLERDNIVGYLKESGYIDTSSGYGNTISLRPAGTDYAKDYLDSRDYRIIKFKNTQHVPFADMAAAGYLFYYNLIDKKKNVEGKTIRIMASDILITNWRLDFSPRPIARNAEKILLQIAKEKIIEKIKEGSLNDYENYLATSSTSPEQPPYNERFLPLAKEAEFIVFIGETIEEEIIANPNSYQNKAAVSIIEKRDEINAVFKERFGEKVFLLWQERSVINLFKISNDKEGFTYNLISLAEMARWMNIKFLRGLTSISDPNKGSVQLLKEFIVQKGGTDLKIIKYLQQLGNLRQAFPAHLDNEQVIQAFDFFKIEYPIQSQDLQSTNLKLLQLYNIALVEFFDFIVGLPK